MELEELKDIWNKNQAAFQQKDKAQLASMLNGSSRSLVDKLKRSVWFELILSIVAVGGLLVYAFFIPSGAVKWTIIAMVLLFILYSIYYIKKILLLNRFTSGDDNLKANLEKLVVNLAGYLKFYKKSYTIVYPVYFAIAMVFGVLDIGSDRFMERLSDPKLLVRILVVMVVFFFVTMVVANWMLYKLYGRHLEKLKTLLEELNRTEEVEDSAI